MHFFPSPSGVPLGVDPRSPRDGYQTTQDLGCVSRPEVRNFPKSPGRAGFSDSGIWLANGKAGPEKGRSERETRARLYLEEAIPGLPLGGDGPWLAPRNRLRPHRGMSAVLRGRSLLRWLRIWLWIRLWIRLSGVFLGEQLRRLLLRSKFWSLRPLVLPVRLRPRRHPTPHELLPGEGRRPQARGRGPGFLTRRHQPHPAGRPPRRQGSGLEREPPRRLPRAPRAGPPPRGPKRSALDPGPAPFPFQPKQKPREVSRGFCLLEIDGPP